MNSYEITVEQMALLEPAVTEVVNTCLVEVMREAVDGIIEQGVPKEAAEAFFFGHVQMALSIILLKTNPMSDACKIACKAGWENIIKPDWKKVISTDFTKQMVKRMLHPYDN